MSRNKCEDERRCPACSKVWAYRQGVLAAYRLRASPWPFEPRHVVVSPDPQAWPEGRTDLVDRLADLREASRKVLKRMGFQGGLLVVHLERHTKGETPVRWFWGPHVHVLGYGDVDADRRPAGWYVETIRKEQATLEGTIAYLADHASTEPKGHVVTWFGTLSYNKMPGVAVPKTDGRPCPTCGEPMTLVQEIEGAMLDVRDVRWVEVDHGRSR